MTVHPLVELKVGPCSGNESTRRRCEMHYDAFIFPKIMDVGDTGLSTHLVSGVVLCNAANDVNQLDPGVSIAECLVPRISNCSIGNGRSQLYFQFARQSAVVLNINSFSAKAVLATYITVVGTPEEPMD